MANRERGEVEVDLGGRTYTLRPTFQALCEIETATGTGLVELVRRVWEGRFGVNDIAVVIWAAARAAHDDVPDRETVGRLVVARGLTRLAGPVAELLAGVLAGTGEGGREKKARGPGPTS